jgi:hypothetical protein
VKRGRTIVVAGRWVDLVPDHIVYHGTLWRAYLRHGPARAECLNLGHAHRLRRDLVAWLRSPEGEAIVRQT